MQLSALAFLHNLQRIARCHVFENFIKINVVHRGGLH